jgi:2-phosphosulfolactate phosphatase
MTFAQTEFDIRCEWGEHGVAQLAPISDAVIIVDVLSFSTCVDIATNRGAIVFPYRSRDESAAAFATSVGAELAGPNPDHSAYSLSAHSLLTIPAGTRLVLPSPNGSTLTLKTGQTPTFTGCLRNYQAVAAAAQKVGSKIAVIPAGEIWADGRFRPALEDWLGAGAIISQLKGHASPEARAVSAAFRELASEVETLPRQCGSGKELIERGFQENVALASTLNVSDCAPWLINGAYIRQF